MRSQRSCRGGGQIAELGPALFLILIVLVFPIIEFLYLGSAYCFGWYLNYEVTRLAAQYAPPPNDTGPRDDAITQFTTQWRNSLGRFTGSNATNLAPVYQFQPGPPPFAESVRVTTRVLVRPFVYVAFFNGVPGLGAPVQFVFNGRATQEERGLN